MEKRKINVALVGATGMIGRTFLEVLGERFENLNIDNLYLYASKRSAGTKIDFLGKELEVLELIEEEFIGNPRKIDYALFSAGGSVSKKFAPILSDNGIVVIDNSSAWRMDKDVPLVVPEVNGEDIKEHKGIIANPNCSTIQAVVPLKVLDNAFKLKRVIYSTYQAVSGAGASGYNDLENGIKGESPKKFDYPIFDNVIPQIDVFGEDGYTFEEIKMINETRKILHNDELKVTATTVRVPVYVSHSESVNLEFEKPFEMKEVFEVLRNGEGIVLEDDTENKKYPMPRFVAGSDEVFVGRVRRDNSAENALNIWVVADNTRKGAATNAIQILEYILEKEI
ncbi:MAG: aspartate-semialdehyde dehydrogenase [Lachnospirales bacterium]